MSEHSGATPATGIGEGTVGDFQAQLAQAARDRAGSWRAVADVLGSPDLALVEGLRAGDQAAAWLRAARWLGADSDVLAAPVTTLEAYARASRRRDVEQDVAAVRGDHEAHIGDAGGPLGDQARAVAELCDGEAAAWSAGDMAAGRAARAVELALITGHLVPGLVPVAGELVREATAQVWRTLGRTLLAVLSVESGTDHRVD